jgi:Domain of unknown function (DUF4349)
MSDSLITELRAAKPVVRPELRERVRSLAAAEPARQPFLARFEWRRLVLVAPATIVLALVAAGVIGLTRNDVSGGGDQAAVGRVAPTTPERSAPPAAFENAPNAAQVSPALPPAAADASGAIAPDPGRVQRYQAELQVRVENLDELSQATQRAQRIAGALGGNISSLSYDAPRGGIGSANIVLRVPVERVQAAMTQLSQLGTILGQRFGIEDLQPAVDDYTRQVERLQRRIASLNSQLANPDLTEENRAILRSRRTAAQQELAGFRRELKATRAEGRFATIALTLTTEKIEAVVPRGDGKLDGIKDVLVWEGVVALYALVVAGPVVLLGVLIWLALRLRRRREETRLLAQA